jgi:hypothetical protein
MQHNKHIRQCKAQAAPVPVDVLAVGVLWLQTMFLSTSTLQLSTMATLSPRKTLLPKPTLLPKTKHNQQSSTITKHHKQLCKTLLKSPNNSKHNKAEANVTADTDCTQCWCHITTLHNKIYPRPSANAVVNFGKIKKHLNLGTAGRLLISQEPRPFCLFIILAKMTVRAVQA